MNVDKVVITTFPGYFFSTILCLKSVQKFVPGKGIDIIIDDFGINQWSDYVTDCQAYIKHQCPELDINFYQFSQIPTVDNANAGGWFRQQLIKLHLDQLLDTDSWLLVDADVVLKDLPDISSIPTVHRPPEPIGIGNRNYVGRMLNIEHPWLPNESQSDFLCVSGVPIRHLTRDLLINLRDTVEQLHSRNFLELHLDLIAKEQLVAYDPDAKKMVMSEFQLIEFFRNKLYKYPLPLQKGAPAFDHTSIKDWNLPQTHFDSIDVDQEHWKKLLNFAHTYI